MNGKISSSGVIDQQTMNTHYLCYQCSKYGPDFLFGNLRIRDCKDEPCFPEKRKLLSCQMKMKTIFKKKMEQKK